jgi:hypothetical protein
MGNFATSCCKIAGVLGSHLESYEVKHQRAWRLAQEAQRALPEFDLLPDLR